MELFVLKYVELFSRPMSNSICQYVDMCRCRIFHAVSAHYTLGLAQKVWRQLGEGGTDCAFEAPNWRIDT